MAQIVTVPVVAYASVSFPVPKDWDIDEYQTEIKEMAEDIISAWYYAPPSVEWSLNENEPIEIERRREQ